MATPEHHDQQIDFDQAASLLLESPQYGYPIASPNFDQIGQLLLSPNSASFVDSLYGSTNPLASAGSMGHEGSGISLELLTNTETIALESFLDSIANEQTTVPAAADITTTADIAVSKGTSSIATDTDLVQTTPARKTNRGIARQTAVGQPTNSRKLQHNETEQRRRDAIKSAFDRLNSLVLDSKFDLEGLTRPTSSRKPKHLNLNLNSPNSTTSLSSQLPRISDEHFKEILEKKKRARKTSKTEHVQRVDADTLPVRVDRITSSTPITESHNDADLKLKELQERIEQLAIENSDLASENKSLNDKLDQLEQDLQYNSHLLSKERDLNKSLVSNYDSKLKSLNSQLELDNSTIEILRNDNSTLQSELADLKGLLSARDIAISNLNSELSNERNKSSNLNVQVAKLSTQIQGSENVLKLSNDYFGSKYSLLEMDKIDSLSLFESQNLLKNIVHVLNVNFTGLKSSILFIRDEVFPFFNKIHNLLHSRKSGNLLVVNNSANLTLSDRENLKQCMHLLIEDVESLKQSENR
ncbi:hypothetical protein BOH78_0139 [Pichia kudriavzevii]|uniref:BHLH domain-containing protein n=1 Tax=Pichia kudriavzevii TaxID=4909 RepID=A0A1V2LUW4_PICKU|nr:hypothetical protein BOH78_0139 [Pichia kudriavzevii]